MSVEGPGAAATSLKYRGANASHGAGGDILVSLGDESAVVFSDEDVDGLDAVLLLKRTGTLLAAWSRSPVDLDIVSVMTATLLGSVETMVQAMHGESPPTLRIESDQAHILVTRLESQAILVLIAPGAARESELRRAARLLSMRLSTESSDARRIPRLAPPAPRSRRNPLPPRKA